MILRAIYSHILMLSRAIYNHILMILLRVIYSHILVILRAIYHHISNEYSITVTVAAEPTTPLVSAALNSELWLFRVESLEGNHSRAIEL